MERPQLPVRRSNMGRISRHHRKPDSNIGPLEVRCLQNLHRVLKGAMHHPIPAFPTGIHSNASQFCTPPALIWRLRCWTPGRQVSLNRPRLVGPQPPLGIYRCQRSRVTRAATHIPQCLEPWKRTSGIWSMEEQSSMAQV